MINKNADAPEAALFKQNRTDEVRAGRVND